MEDLRTVLNAGAEDHHCHDHAHFTETCESCGRARAAFLPYQNVAAHPEPASRSFQTNLGPAFVAPAISPQDQMKMPVTSGVIEGIIDTLFGK